MLNYILRRLLILPIILIGVSILLFGMMMMLSPYQRLSTYINSPSQLQQENLDKLINKYGLKDPFYLQYSRWLKNILKGDWGWSEAAGQPVTRAILSRFPATLELTLLSLLPVILGGISLGIFSAVHHNDPWDHVTRIFAIIGWSFPTFVFGLLLLMFFYGILGWFPPGRLDSWALQLVNSPDFIRYTGLNILDGIFNANPALVWNALRHMIAPVISISILWWAYILRITRSAMLETLTKDYIRTARAKGVQQKEVVYKHAARNALIPVATVAGLMLRGLLVGLVVVETIFGYRGLGKFAARAAQQLDYAAVLGISLYTSIILVLVNLAVDISYVLIDPRIRLE